MYEFGTRKLVLAERARTEFAQPALTCRPTEQRIKRVIDLVCATSLALFLLPLLAIVAFAVKTGSRGPVIFSQMRTGRAGRPFRIFKFRTMEVMEDGDEVVQVTRNDVRLTEIGRFLRRTSIDELPQLLNVIRGEMSLVGPRPHAIAHDLEFEPLAPDYRLRFRMRPGITGLAQISGHRGAITSAEQIVNRIKLDNAYIDNWSLMEDFKILLKTALGLPFHRAF